MDGPTLLVCAGDPSGDALAARALAAWRCRHPTARIVGLGGPALLAAGLEPLDLSPFRWPFPSPTGIVEPLAAVPALVRGIGAAAARARRGDVGAAVLVDLPDVNLRLGRRLRAAGIRVVQLVAPQTWAWRAGRERDLARSCEVLAVILPFEERRFRALGIDARYVGHPLLDRPVPSAFASDPVGPVGAGAHAGLPASERPSSGLPVRLAILPGSRPERVRHLLPPLVAAAAALARRGLLREVRVSRAEAIPVQFVAREVAGAGIGCPVEIDSRSPGDWLPAEADQAWVAAGTATLEAALAGVPALAAFRTGAVGAWAARRLVRGRFAALPNRLLGCEALPELIQEDLTVARIEAVFHRLATPAGRAAAVETAARLRSVLGGPGFAERTADLIDEAVA